LENCSETSARPAARQNLQGFFVSEVKWDRKPYTITYQKDGKTHTQRRIPPPKLHEIEVGDKVTLTRRKGEDWDDGDEVKIKHISGRQPNTLQVERDGKVTFVPYFDMNFKGRPGASIVDEDEKAIARDPLGSRYLLWP
jgi:hypothetical protein